MKTGVAISPDTMHRLASRKRGLSWFLFSASCDTGIFRRKKFNFKFYRFLWEILGRRKEKRIIKRGKLTFIHS
jgi:hypothetical protein